MLNLAYSFKLKHVVIIDVLIVAAGFVLRVAAGVPLVDVVRFSPWLYMCMALLALFLGFAKRRQELMLLKDNAINSRAILEEYNLEFVDSMQNVIMACTIIAYSLYTFLAEGLPANHTMMLTIPFVLYGIFRYLYLVHVRGEIAPPDEVALKDRPLQIDAVLWALSVVIILYVLPEVTLTPALSIQGEGDPVLLAHWEKERMRVILQRRILMSTLLIHHIQNLITMNADRQQLADGAIFVRDNFIEYVGPTADLPPDRAAQADRVIDAREMIILPGLVNTHHHLYQTLTRCIAVDSGLFNWLKTLYPIWARMDGEAVYASALTGMAELILSGCTTSSDHSVSLPQRREVGR